MSKLLNPYQDREGNPRIRTSLTAFLDVLGFADSIRQAATSNQQQEHLNAFKSALDEAHQLYREDRVRQEEFGDLVFAPYMLKVFTDNIVLGVPIYDDGESEFGRMIQLAGNYQFTLLKHGFFVRGGITVGDLYMDEDTAYGNALLDAYFAERDLARDPRIVLDRKAMELVHQHLTYYGRVSIAPHNEDLLVDSDGQLFLNYLMISLDGGQPDEEYLSTLGQHRTIIISKLKEFATNPRLWSKYMWSGLYHNVVCTDFLDRPEFLIPDDLLRQPARRLDAAYTKDTSALYRGNEKVATWKSMYEVRKQWRQGKES